MANALKKNTKVRLDSQEPSRKKEIISQIITTIFTTALGSGVVFGVMYYMLETKKNELELVKFESDNGQRVIEYYSQQKELWIDMYVLRRENEAILNRQHDSGQPMPGEDSLKLLANEEKVKQIQKVYLKIEAQLAALEKRPAQDPFHVPGAPKFPKIMISHE